MLFDHIFYECFDIFGVAYYERFPEEHPEILQYVDKNETDYIMHCLCDKDEFMNEMQSKLLQVMFNHRISFANYNYKVFNKSVVAVW